jgi:hypothetical protein
VRILWMVRQPRLQVLQRVHLPNSAGAFGASQCRQRRDCRPCAAV